MARLQLLAADRVWFPMIAYLVRSVGFLTILAMKWPRLIRGVPGRCDDRFGRMLVKELAAHLYPLPRVHSL